MTHRDEPGLSEAPSCSLSPDALTGRVSEWRALSAHAVRRQVEAGRVVSRYPNRPEIAQWLARLVAAESDCCPFLDFDVHEHDGVIDVELRYPPQFAPMLTAVLGGDDATAR